IYILRGLNMPEEKEEELDPIEAIRRRNLERAKKLKEILKFGDFGLGTQEAETIETAKELEPDAVIDKIMSEEIEVPSAPLEEEKALVGEPTEFEELDLSAFTPSFWEEEEVGVPPPPIPEEVQVAEERIEEEVAVSARGPELEISEIPSIEEEVSVDKEIVEIPSVEKEVPVEEELVRPVVEEIPVEEKIPEKVEAVTPLEVKKEEEKIQVMIEVEGNRVRIGRRNITLSDVIELLENIIRRYREMKDK
ncbi:MAG: hypothetical protein ACUVWP_03860, partial [bacterium]